MCNKYKKISNDKVILMDMLCISPYYDVYLYSALEGILNNLALASISYHLDLSIHKKNNINNDPGLLDFVSKLNIKHGFIRGILKVVEYTINLASFSIRFIFKKPKLVHIQWLPLYSYLPQVELVFIWVIKKMGINLVYTVHNVLPHDTDTKYLKRYKELYKKMDALICHTERAKEILMNEFEVKHNKIWVIPHGPMFHDTKQIEVKDARSFLNLSDESVAVLFFGAIKKYKGIELLINSWQDVVRAQPNSILIIAGSGDGAYLKKIKEQVISLQLEDSIITNFYFIPTNELPIYHQAADVLVYPYKNITQSGALLTGMTFGKAIVATNTGGFAETLENGKNAILTEYDKNELAKALIDLIENRELRGEIGKKVLRESKENYAWDSIAKQTVDCYLFVINDDTS